MNPILFRAARSAAHTTQALHQKLDGIATGVSELQAQNYADAPSSAANVVGVENGEAGGGDVAVQPEVRPVSPAPESKLAAPVASSAAARDWPALPPVPDLRPELAAFNAALAVQHQAVLGTLRQATVLCHLQQRQVEQLARELATLTNRVNRIPFR